ncbi:LodA/GoxA family CTQ-dependent oxidase [Pseudomonas donghuensis]|uniref:LodA/GoxA family CTQ-dependent oxidase n=1 Tax=Pseudomonas donghuensis TaxID=1163398 RepID=UPI002E139FA0|nr:LodA/GoxA family CTQ-dependent oxidase [Pseudomonas donghuensis]
MAKPIVRASIHPAIGVARVGSSPDAYLLAAQVPFPELRKAGSSHDENGQLKREAVEFRVYGYDADGQVVAELNAENAKVTWTVHVANAKAAWFKFRHAMDVPSLADTVVERRNPSITDPSERRRLVIDPGPRSIVGRNEEGKAEYRFDTGHFKDLEVSLGELRTDGAGRLLYFSGLGVSQSPSGAPLEVTHVEDAFGNSVDWHDDIADGPVDALVVFDGRVIPTEGAWVASAPPNYAPDLKSWRTLYDLLEEVFVGEGWMPKKTATSFTSDIYPILSRLSSLQWVNKASAAIFGHGAPFDFGSPEFIDKVCRQHGGEHVDIYKPLRHTIQRMFRVQTEHPSDPGAWPWQYGDAFGTTPREKTEPHLHLALVEGGARYEHLQNWVKGDFEADWGAVPAPPTTIDGYPVEQQPSALDRAALDFCVADAFHPGIEFTWPMRHASLFSKPFRIKRSMTDERDYGSHLDVQTALGADGPLHGQSPGSLTRWMLVPWQYDTGGCLAGYSDGVCKFDVPTFWPTRVPNFVLPHANYLQANDSSLSDEDRVYAFQNRRSWFSPFGCPAADWSERLVNEFGLMGVVEAYDITAAHPRLPAVMYVETYPGGIRTAALAAGAGVGGAELAVCATEEDRLAQEAGFASEADRAEMRARRFGRQ